MSSKIYAPNVHLFAFHLKDSNQPNLLWDKCNYLLSQKFGVTKPLEIEEHQGYRVDLLKDKTDDNVSLNFESTVYQNGIPLPIAGLAVPLRIHDSYVLTLNLRRPEFDENDKKTNPVELNFLKLLNSSGCLMPNEIGGSLGQTILLTVWYTPEKQWLLRKYPQNRQKLRELANDCIREFIPNNYPCPDFNKEDQLFGSPIFEYGVPDQDKDYCHILVWVYCKSETSESFVDSYNSFVNLFYYLNKIVAAYHRSRKVYQVLSREYKDIEGYVNQISQEMSVNTTLNERELKKLKEHLKIIPLKLIDYLKFIRELDLYRLPIDINAQNYKQELRDIQNQFPNEDISFLYRFYEEDVRLFNEQIQSDKIYLTNGIELLEKTLTAIQVRVEIEQVESDRKFQENLQSQEQHFQETLSLQQRRWQENLSNQQQHFQTALTQQQQQRQEELRKQDEYAQHRERNLQLAVAFFGVGFAVSGISSQVNSKPLEIILGKSTLEQSQTQPISAVETITLNIADIFIHIGIGLLSGLIAILIVFIFRWCKKSLNH